MKSAYEIALEKMMKDSGPTRTLTDDQKARIAEIDKRHEAKVAEEKLAADAKRNAAPAEQAAIQEALAARLAELETTREQDKEAVWDESAAQ